MKSDKKSDVQEVYAAIINHGGVTHSLNVFCFFDDAVEFLANRCKMSEEEKKVLFDNEVFSFDEGDNDVSIWKCLVNRHQEDNACLS